MREIESIICFLEKTLILLNYRKILIFYLERGDSYEKERNFRTVVQGCKFP